MVRTRIAPSPTGQDLHIGNLYTALFNWAWAKKNKGNFIVRIEDTDQSRLIDGSEKRILETLTMYGLSPDESPIVGGRYAPYRQSERLQLYQDYGKKLIEKGLAYYCICSSERLAQVRREQKKEKHAPCYDKHCRDQHLTENDVENGKYVIRLAVPKNEIVTFNDVIRGEISFTTTDIDDQVLIKSDGFPTYHMAVVIDDNSMGISHVIRGEEWISSTPKHVLLYRAFGWKLPVFVHMPILRNPDKSKLSKRKNPVWARWYLDEGYLPEAVLNYLALMGFSHPEGKEVFDLNELIAILDFSRVASAGPVFDAVKLSWMNGEYIRKLDAKSLKSKLLEYFKNKYSENLIEKTIPLIQERIKTLKEYDEYCRFFIESPTEYEIDLSEKKDMLKNIYSTCENIPTSEWNGEAVGQYLQEVAQASGVSNSKFFMALRIAITGRKVTPPLNESMEVLGKEECLKRLKKLI